MLTSACDFPAICLSEVTSSYYYMSKCLLSQQDIGAITETDHKVRQCLCHLCTCGQHRCPSEPRKQKGSYATNYQDTYRHKTPVNSTPHQPVLYHPNLGKVDFETSHMRDFKTFLVQPATESPVRLSTPSLRFTGHSSYAADFPNWGGMEMNIEKRPQLPVHHVRFRGRSQYQSAYAEIRVSSPSKATPKKESSILMGTWENPTVTTARSSYRPFTPSQGSPVKPRPVEQYSALSVSPVHFRSCSQAEYQPKKSPYKDPHMLVRRTRHS